MEQLVAMACRVIAQHQHRFLAVLLLLVAGLGSQLHANAQQEYKNTQGYACSDSGTKSCNTFLLYRAQEKYSNVSQISELFNSNATVVAELNKLSAKQTLDMGKAIIIPVTCRCRANSISFANISYTIVDGDFFYDLNRYNFEFLSTQSAIEAANRKLKPENLSVGQKIVLPLRCACPSKAQTSKGVKSLVTYPVVEGDGVDAIASRFGVSSADVINANTLAPASNPRINYETTLLIPIYSSPPSYRDPNEGPPAVEDPEAPPPDGTASGKSNGGGSSKRRILIYFLSCLAGLVCLAGLAYYREPLYTLVWRRQRLRDGRTDDVEDPFVPCPARPDDTDHFQQSPI